MLEDLLIRHKVTVEYPAVLRGCPRLKKTRHRWSSTLKNKTYYYNFSFIYIGINILMLLYTVGMIYIEA